ncbi:MAG: hypothetical protein Q8R96_22380 [Bacteroidota bacterium]|nr:hypothetical protein [Bacteroidota bacterium]
MKTYFADIIPKIQRYSQKLDNLTLLTNQHWVVLDELEKAKTVYIFRQTNELLISTNGQVEKAKWEYLGQNSLLIDLKGQSYLFRHGFFDENIIALKIDSKEEYAILINESKYQGELNSITAVLSFLNKNYLVNPVSTNNLLEKSKNHIANIKLVREGYTFKMGSFKEFVVLLSGGQTFSIYKRKSNGEYFIYSRSKLLLFPDKETCLNYINGRLK